MKLLFAIKNMTDAKGGAEKVLAIVMNGLVNKGHDITLLTFDERGIDTFYEIDKRIKRVSLGIGKSSEHAGFIETTARMKAMRKVVKVRKPDVIIPFMHSMFIPMSLALIGLSTPVIASEHIVPQHYKKKWTEFLLLMISSLFVKKITVLSASIIDLYPRFIRKKMVVVPNPVHIYPCKDDKKQYDPSRKIILNVGRLSDQKDQKTLIRAFSLIAEKYPTWDVRIAGEGENREFLENLIDEKGLRNRIHLIGTTPNIAQEYKMAQIFAMPSKYESFGLATAEAMFFGIPAVGFIECDGTNEIIHNKKNGLLTLRKGNHIENFSHALETLMKCKKMRKTLGNNAKKDIIKYQPELIVDRWEVLISNIYNASN